MITADDVRFLLRKTISFHRPLADVAGGATGGLFLSQLLYWSDRGHDPDGWIYKTQEQWEEETALTRSEQERARRVLRDKGVLEEVKRGVPARLFYRLNIEALARMLDSASKDVSSRNVQAREQETTGKDVESCIHSPITENTTENTSEEDDATFIRLEGGGLTAARRAALAREHTRGGALDRDGYRAAAARERRG